MGAVGSKKISVSIDETVSIKDAITEVSNLAGIDIEKMYKTIRKKIENKTEEKKRKQEKNKRKRKTENN